MTFDPCLRVVVRAAALFAVATGVLVGCAPMPTQKQAVTTKAAPEAIGPYSQAIRAGGMLFLSGQLPIDPRNNQLMKDASIEDQTKLVLDNLKAVLEANGMTMANVVSTSVFVKDLNDFPKMNAVYGTYFPSTPPARATVEVARLPRDVKIEISAIAMQ